jgi:hypothetical protein
MSAANSSAAEQKIDTVPTAQQEQATPPPPPMQQPPKLFTPSDVVDNLTEEEQAELLVWPPRNYKDKFTKPKFFVAQLINHLQKGACMLANASSPEEVLAQGEAVKKEPAGFFSYSPKVEMPKPGSPEMKDWMNFPLPDNPGACKTVLLHKQIVEFIELTCQLFGNVAMKFHTVPHPEHHSVYTPSELFLVQAGANVDLLEVPVTQKCLYCKRPRATGVCKCEKVFFCAEMCRSRAIAAGLHTEAECTKAMRDVVLQSWIDARHVQKEFEKFKKLEAERKKAEEEVAAAKQSTVTAAPPPAPAVEVAVK